MAIVEMQKLSICAGKKNRKAILEMLQSLGVMEVMTEGIEDPELLKMDTLGQRQQFQKESELIEQALKTVSKYAPEKKAALSMLNGREALPRSEYDAFVGKKEECLKDVQAINRKDKNITECRGIILKDENQKETLRPWMALDIPMDFKGTKKTSVLIGTVQGIHSEEEVYAMAVPGISDEKALCADILSAGNELTYVSVLCLSRDAEKVEENLRAKGFSKPAQLMSGVPSRTAEELDKDIATQKARIEELIKDIASFESRKEEFRVVADYDRTRAEKYRLLGTIPQSKEVFFLEGWVTRDSADSVAKLLTERYGAVVEKEETKESDTEPVVLHNNRFSRSVEPVLASYGLPSHGHVDPTFIMSFFYVIFFGMMLSDAAYGIIMFIACAILLKKFKKMPEGISSMLHLFFWCGISTTFWGFMYGGFFGNAADVIAQTFFGYTGPTPLLKPLWFEPLGNPMRLLVWCMLFGVIHLYAGLGIKGWECLKAKDFVGFISDIVAWYLFLTGLILMLLPTELFASISQVSIVFPAWLNALSKYMAIAGAAIILVMAGRDRKNWALRIVLGAYSLYGVSGWLSDILSYSRLLALGLATGVIANVINMMASMVGGGIVGAIVFIIVFVIGHLLNLAINALGAYVHTNRLQYVEFFGKFYDAGGKAFKPFQTANKYIEVKEEKVL